MTAYSDTDELNAVMENLWTKIRENKKISERLLQSRLIVRFCYQKPNGALTIDASDGRELKIHIGACAVKPTVELFMNSDFAHDFWLGKENPALALLQGKITSRGPVNKALALLPAIKPALSYYPAAFDEVRSKTA
jgi:putative sterol carrier protein